MKPLMVDLKQISDILKKEVVKKMRAMTFFKKLNTINTSKLVKKIIIIRQMRLKVKYLVLPT